MAPSRATPLDAVWQNVVARTRGLVDAALDRVFAEPFVVRDAEHFEQLLTEHRPALTNTAFRRFLEAAASLLVLVGRRTGRRVPIPAVRYTVAALPFVVGIGSTARRGVREIQVVASYLVGRFRAAGVDAPQDLVASLALSIVWDPDRRPSTHLGARRASAALARKWILQSLASDSPTALHGRARAYLAAVDRLDLAALAAEWSERRGGAGTGE